jgi:1-acyl-sn-glycerol-3-phosphate acyltransferase
MDDWNYKTAPDLEHSLARRLREFPRQPHLWMYVLRLLYASLVRAWLKLYHRFEIRGAAKLPVGRSFILVANHQSHLDVACLSSAIPVAYLHRSFPAAAADYFFESLAKSALSSTLVNAIPFDRKKGGAESLEVCRQLLANPGNILILFPEGTRSADGRLGRFRAGIAHLVAGTTIPVLPCYLEGAFAAFPKGRRWPRPGKLRLNIGDALFFEQRGRERKSLLAIAGELEEAVRELGPSLDKV